MVGSTATQIASNLLAELTHQQHMYEDFSKGFRQMKEDFDELEKQLTEPRPRPICHWTDWVLQYFAYAKVFFEFAQNIEKDLVAPATALRDEMSEKLTTIEKQRLAEKAKYEKAETRYQKSYTIYETKCQEVEAVGREHDAEAAINGNVTESELLKEEKGKCYELEKVAYDECNKFAVVARRFDYEMERLLVELEGLVRKFSEGNHKLTSVFVGLLKQLDVHYERMATLACQGLEKLEKEGARRESEAERRVISGIVDQFSQLPAMNLDIFSYLSWRQVFASEIGASYFSALEEIGSADGKEMTLKPGQMCKSLSKKGTLRLVENMETGLRGWIQRSKLKKRKDYTRTVYRVKEDLLMENKKVLAGQYVLLLRDLGKTVVCRSATGERGEIPIEKLDPAS